MKIYLRYSKGLFLALMLTVAVTSLFAAKYNEPRKVLTAKYNNALYKNLSVTGEMSLNVDGNSRKFLMEIGKRPTYFWDANNAFHVLQTQTLTLNNIQYGTTAGNTFNVGTVNVPKGVFLSQEGFTYGELQLSNNNAGIIVTHPNLINMNLNIMSGINDGIRFYTNNLILTMPASFVPTVANTLPIGNFTLRDLYVNRIDFVSPRMTITRTNGVYAAHGTARLFDLPLLNESGTLVNYYEDWSVHTGTGVVVGVSGSCGNIANDTKRCRKKYVCKNGVVPPAGIDCSNPSKTYIWEDENEIFTCAGKRYEAPGTPGETYDIILDGGYCNDYYKAPPVVAYNYDVDPYEFKVQEVFRAPANETPVLIEQTPKFRTRNNNIEPISKDTANVWTVFDNANIGNYQIWANSGTVTGVDSLPVIASNNARPCLTLCNGISCETNKVYIRDNRQIRFVKDDNNPNSNNNHWPISSESKLSRLAVVEYTVGVCPAIGGDVESIYIPHEENYQTAVGNRRMMNGLIVQSGNNFVAPEVCLVRRIYCSHGKNDGYGVSRKYKPLSTDY